MAQFTPSPIWAKEQWARLRQAEAVELQYPPYSNTGGKFRDRASADPDQVCKIDWLSLSIPGESLDVPHPDLAGDPRGQWLRNLAGHVRDWTGQDVDIVDQGKGMHGFSDSASIILRHSTEVISLGKIAWGGSNQKGRVYLSLPGTATAMIQDWQYMHDWCQEKNAKITRIDFAVDFLEGEITLDQAAQAYRNGDFNTGGNAPSVSQVGNWLTQDNKGRTLYVGKKENGKELCIYEKGKQLGDALSQWVRAEARILAKDRSIPLEALTDPLRYWRGSAPWFASLVEGMATKIQTLKKVAQQTITNLVGHASRSYGKLLDVLMDCTGEDAEQVVSLIRRPGCPSRAVHPLAVVGFGGALALNP